MPLDSTEALLRDTLQARVSDTGSGSGPDPWLRVSRAHRRSRARRRTVAVSALAVVAIATGTLATTQPWTGWSRNTQPADDDRSGGSPSDLGWLKLDDGRPRGALGRDPALRQAAIDGLQQLSSGNSNGPQLVRPDTLHVLWGGMLEGKRVALVRAVESFQGPAQPVDTDVLIWMVGPAKGGALTQLTLDTNGPWIKVLPYLDRNGGQRLLAVVRRNSSVDGSRTRISPADGELRQGFTPVVVKDGVVDVPVSDPAGRGPLMLMASAFPSERMSLGLDMYQFASSASPFSPSSSSAPPNGLTVARRQALAEQARGPGLPWQQTSLSVDKAITQLWSDAAHTDPRVEWAGAAPAARGGGSLVVATAGFPVQGRVLIIQRTSQNQDDSWHFVGTALGGDLFGAARASAWRLPWADPATSGGKRQVVVWMFGPDTRSVTVKVNGQTRPTTTQDGLGWLEVDPKDEVKVTGRRSSGGDAELLLHPKDVQPVRPDAPIFGVHWPKFVH